MSVLVDWFQEIKFGTGLKLVALPASCDTLFLTALSYFAEWRSTSQTASLVTAKFNHCSQHLIAFVIVFKCLAESHLSHRIGELLILGTSQFLPKVAGIVLDFLLIAVAVPAVESAV